MVNTGPEKRKNSFLKNNTLRGICKKDTVQVICFGDKGGLWANHVIKIFWMSRTFLLHLKFHRAFALLYRQVDQELQCMGLTPEQMFHCVVGMTCVSECILKERQLRPRISPGV